MNRITTAIILLARFGWLRSFELGLFLYPKITANEQSRRTIARRVISQLKRQKHVETYRLPSGGEAIFLSRAGVSLAQDLGEKYTKPFHPRVISSSWRHDCYVAQMIFSAAGGELDNFVTEFQLFNGDGPPMGRPDALVFWRDRWLLLETENSRKSGNNLRRQALRVADVVRNGNIYAGREVNGALLTYPVNVDCVNHRTRLVNSLHDTDLKNGDYHNLIFAGFQISNPTHAIARLTLKVGKFMCSAFNTEIGLPDEIPTGQKRGAQRKYERHEVDLQRDDEYDSSAYFIINNLRTNLDASPDGGITQIVLEVDGVEAGVMSFPQPIEFEQAIDRALAAISRLPCMGDGRFILPQSCYH